MDIRNVKFPLYKLRAYLEINKNPLGLVKVTTIKGTYILDDISIPGTFAERRLKLAEQYPKEKIYKLKEQVIYLRQLIKYKTGTTFIDYEGNIIKYKKSSKLFDVKAHKITRKRPYHNWTIIELNGIEIPFLVGEPVKETTTHASVMYTEWGPLLYDLTNKDHDIYKRKI
jgi:hypothetical protein